MEIAFDIDGVLTDYEWFLNTYGKKYLKKRRMNHILRYPGKYRFRERFDCSEKTERRFFTRYLLWYARKFPVRENAATVMKKLRQEGHGIHIITARALTDRTDLTGRLMRYLLKKWLKQNDIPYDSISYVPVKQGSMEKERISRKKGIDVFVEDDPENIEALRGRCRVICMDASYNSCVKEVERTVDFGGIYQIIHERDGRQLRYRDYITLDKEEQKKYLEQLRHYFMGQPFDEKFKADYEHFIIHAVVPVSWFLRRCFNIQIEGGHFLRQKKPVIYVCNHRSAMDIILAYCILDDIPARFLIKREVRWYQFLQIKCGTIFVVREDTRSRQTAKNSMLHTLMHGGNILLFPEGTRNRTKQPLLPFHISAVQMAQITGCPVVPMVFKYNQRKCRVYIDHPIYVGEEDDLNVINDCIRQNMCQIFEKK